MSRRKRSPTGTHVISITNEVTIEYPAPSFLVSKTTSMTMTAKAEMMPKTACTLLRTYRRNETCKKLQDDLLTLSDINLSTSTDLSTIVD